MLRIRNTDKLMGKGFYSHGLNWEVTHVIACIDPAQYIFTIENYDNAVYYKFELFTKEVATPGEYRMDTIDRTNKIIDSNLIKVDNIKTRDSMLTELKFIVDKMYK
jgi:hypothetical protein